MNKKLWSKILISLFLAFFIASTIYPSLDFLKINELGDNISLNSENDFSSQKPVTIDNINEIIESEKLNPDEYGNGYIEHMDVCIERDELLRSKIKVDFNNNKQGIWFIPSRGATYYPYSGNYNAINKWGDTKMGISFPTKVNLHGAWFAGQGGGEGVWAKSIRVFGYFENELTQTTDWFDDIDDTPSWFEMNLQGIDRIVIEATPVFNGAGWYAMDDLTYTPKIPSEHGQSEKIILDFEECAYKQNLNETKYGGLTWENGEGVYIKDTEDSSKQEKDSNEPIDNAPISPISINNFQGVIRGDAESWSYPPDSCGAVGPNHFVETVNRNFAVYNKTTGEELINILLGSFLPGSNGDPRVLYDQYSNRWFVIVCDFTTKIFLAVSTSDDPTDEWFKCDFVVSQGSDAGKWPDYPTLGVDEDGIYTAAYMIGGGYGMSIFALEKAPLIAPNPSLGDIYAFRELPFEGAIQPVHTYGSCQGEYFVSRMSATSIRVRLLTDLLTNPSLTELGCATIPNHYEPPDAPALGSTIPLDTVGHRLMNAVYRDGYIWTAHCIGLNGRAASRWYKIDTYEIDLSDYGTISDPYMYYFFPSIMVNSDGNVVMGFSGSSPAQYAAAYYTGRLANDPPGEMDPPVLLKAGEDEYNLIDGYGRNRWGDYSLCSLDPTDEYTLWTIQEYAHSQDNGECRWGTWIGQLEYSNRAPAAPSIEGPTEGNAGTSYNYTFNAVDPDNDDLFIYIKWGDGYVEPWDGPYPSSEDFQLSHTYDKEGTFIIEAQVKDTNDLESGWTTLNVTMPRTKDDFDSLFYRLIERFPFLKNLINLYINIFGDSTRD